MVASNIAAMQTGVSYDFVIVCCSNEHQERFWQRRLEASSVLPATTQVLAVHEDWAGGAGNALGTLYAYSKAARAYAASDKAGDLDAALAAGASVALFHTAGKGTRLAPLPGSENNNKPGVKLPGIVGGDVEGGANITILEAVIKQTGIYAECRKGRLSVFWGDQVRGGGRGGGGGRNAGRGRQGGGGRGEGGWRGRGVVQR